MRIVPMTAAHTAALAELEALCFSSPWSRQQLEDETENPNACFLTALEGDRVLGYGGMQFAAGEFYIANIAVFPEARRRGVGRALMTALETEARSRNGEFISLEVRPSNAGAVALYAALGYREAGRRKNFYTAPVEDGLILTKMLADSKKAAPKSGFDGEEEAT